MAKFSTVLMSWIVAGLLSLSLGSNAQAHSAGIATYIIEQNDHKDWKLTISVPLGALHQALKQQHSESELWGDQNEYNSKLATDYLISSSNIKVNGVALILNSTQTNLNDHQSDFVFSIANMPSPQLSVDFLLLAMSENLGHINIARLKTRYANKKMVLQSHNNYKGQLIF